MKRYAWLLLAVLPVGLAAYMLRTSPTPAPARASGGEVSDTQMSALLAEAISARNSKGSTAADANTPGAAGPATPDMVQDPTLVEQNEILAVDAYAAEEKQKIDAWYTNELVGLKTLLEQRMKRVSSNEMPGWTKFHALADKWWFLPPDGPEYASFRTYPQPQPNGVSRPGASVRQDPAKAYKRSLDQLKYTLDAQMWTFEAAHRNLVFLRKDKLALLQDEVAKRKAAAAQKQVRAQADLARKLAGDPTPLVDTIAATADNRFCASIEGALVREGSVVQGYRVRKIDAGSVEFEKDGQVWVQKVN